MSQGESILKTKLQIPPLLPRCVARYRLIERLNAGLARTPAVTLLSAPAGFGKTVLLTEWLQQLGGEQQSAGKSPISESTYRVAWLSLDETENDPIRFFTHLVMALQTIWPGCGHAALSMLQASRHPTIEAPLVVLINELTAVEERLILVLDDYQVIDTQPVHDSLNFLLENLPRALHLVMAPPPYTWLKPMDWW